MEKKEFVLFQIFFIVAALWNMIGVIFGYLNTEYTFQGLFGRELTDPLFYAIYHGAWGTTLVYFFGYFIVAKDPLRHTGIVIVGGIGKVGYAITMLKLFLAGIASSYALIIIIGDFIFSVIFVVYFYRLFRLKLRIL
ncbi:MAG: hypothetical protein P8179_10475 [Candidatus Thiodiazotropha sp.]